MSRRRFLEASLMAGAAAAVGLLPSPARAQAPAPTSGAGKRIRIAMGGYSPASTSFSRGLKVMGDRLEARFGGDVEAHYVYNIIDAGYNSRDLTWLVESGVLTVAYATLSEGIPELDAAALPFLYSDAAEARAVVDGELGRLAAARIESQMNVRVLGFFENGFRHISNRVRPVRTPDDLSGLKIRVLGDVLFRTFQLLGADPQPLALADALRGLEAGTLDGQENPFTNVITYGIHRFQRFYTESNHSYFSRPVFVHRPSFDAWPTEVQEEMRDAVREAVRAQRALHDEEEARAADTIRQTGGEILTLSARELDAFRARVTPIYEEARSRYDRNLLRLVGV